MTTRISRRAFACALLATTAIVAAPALADNPKYRNWDENGVDMVHGDYRFNFVEGSIGSGKSELSLIRVNNSDAFSQWDQIALNQTTDGSARITMPDGSDEVFVASVTTEANGSSLTGGAGSQFYQSADGTQIEFYNPVPTESGTEFCTSTSSSCKLLPKTITMPDRRTVAFSWTVTGSGTNHTARLESITNSDGYSIVFNYQSKIAGTAGWSRRSSSVFKNGTTAARTISYAYPSSGTTDLTDATNNTWRVTSSSIRRPNEVTPGLSISASAGVVTSVTADGVTTAYVRSVNGNIVTLTKTTAGDATVITSDLSIDRIKSIRDPVLQTTTFDHDSGRLSEITAPEGNSVEYVLDARGNPSETLFHPKTGSPSPALSYVAAFSSTCNNEYICNKASSLQDPAGIVYTFGYSVIDGQLNSKTAPAVNGVAGQVRYGYQNTNGIRELILISTCQTADQSACIGTTDEIKTTLSYGANANVTNITTADGTGALSASRNLTYNASGDVLTVDGPLPGTADTTTYRYDAMRRLVGVIDPDPDATGPLKRRAVRYSYDGAGRVTLKEVVTVVDASDPSWANFATSFQQSGLYNSNDRIIRQKLSAAGADYSIVDYVYDSKGRLSCSITYMDPTRWSSQATSCVPLQTNGPNGPDRVVKYSYDAADRPTEIRLAVGTSDEAPERTFTYTANGQVRTLRDGENNLTTYNYDEYDRFSKLQYPVPTKGANASSTTDYEQLTYDTRSNVTSRRLRDGTSIGYTIDALNRVSFKDLPGTEADVTYTYDNQDKIRTASSTQATLTFGYDNLGRRTSESGPQGTATSALDLAGRRIQLTYPGTGLYVNYDYLTTGEVQKIRENGAATGVGVLATYAYDDLGNRTGVTFGNGVTQTYGHDSVSRLTSLTNNLSGATNDLTVSPIAYNPASQITSAARAGDAYAFGGYVNLNRGYTSNGLNQYTTAGAANFTYDTKGNLTADGTTGYCYSSENLLTGSGGTCSAPIVGLAYDPLLRLYQVTGNSTTRMAYDGLNIIADYDGSNALQHRYVFGSGMDEPLVEYAGTGTTSRTFLSADERGSIIARTDSSGALLTPNTYDEYGIPGSSNSGLFQYTGQAWISQLGTGLYYYKARFYSAFLGRFMQPDPIGQADSPNLYAYVSNDPVNNVDPLGLLSCGAGDICITAKPSPPGSAPPPVTVPSHLAACVECDGDTSHQVTTAEIAKAQKDAVKSCAQSQQSAACAATKQEYLDLSHIYSKQHPLPSPGKFIDVRPDLFDTIVDLTGCIALDSSILGNIVAAGLCIKGGWELGNTIIPEQRRTQ